MTSLPLFMRIEVAVTKEECKANYEDLLREIEIFALFYFMIHGDFLDCNSWAFVDCGTNRFQNA